MSGSGSPCCCTAMRNPRTPIPSRYSSTSADDSEGGDQASVRPVERIAPRAFGPRAISVPAPSAPTSSSPMPHSVAACTQPRKPIPVVATVMSGTCSISLRVAASSSVSSTSGTIRNAGPCRTVAPRRSIMVPSSSARRAAVTPTAKPANGGTSAALDTDAVTTGLTVARSGSAGARANRM